MTMNMKCHYNVIKDNHDDLEDEDDINDRQVSMARLYHSTRATEQSHTSHLHTANHTVIF